jgi:hypothetical protein
MLSRAQFIATAVLGALALGACQTDGLHGLPYMGGKDNFGEANRQTYAAQIVDPAPVYDRAVPESDGQHAAAAIERYHTDKVKQPDVKRTSNVGGIGGSSSAN